jgi:hypothetical protein
VEIFVIVINIQVEESKEHVTLKFISLAFPHIGIVVEVTMMDIIIHASEVFKTPNIILKDTLVT